MNFDVDDFHREGETDIFFPAINLKPENMRYLRREAGGEMYVAIANEVARHFDLPYASDVFTAASDTFSVLKGMDKYTGDMCQGRCSVGLSFDHRQFSALLMLLLSGFPPLQRRCFYYLLCFNYSWRSPPTLGLRPKPTSEPFPDSALCMPDSVTVHGMPLRYVIVMTQASLV